MTVAINLTPVLITLIICVTLCVICKMGQKDKKKKTPELKDLNAPEFMNRRNMHVVNNGKEGAGKQ